MFYVFQKKEVIWWSRKGTQALESNRPGWKVGHRTYSTHGPEQGTVPLGAPSLLVEWGFRYPPGWLCNWSPQHRTQHTPAFQLSKYECVFLCTSLFSFSPHSCPLYNTPSSSELYSLKEQATNEADVSASWRESPVTLSAWTTGSGGRGEGKKWQRHMIAFTCWQGWTWMCVWALCGLWIRS